MWKSRRKGTEKRGCAASLIKKRPEKLVSYPFFCTTLSLPLTGTPRLPCNWWLLPREGNSPLLALSSCPAAAGSPTAMPWSYLFSPRNKSLLDSISLGSKLKVTWMMAYKNREMTFAALFPAYIKKIFKRTGAGVMQHSSTKISDMKPNGMDWGSGPFPVTFFLFICL